ncbi:IS66 family insertion sequence element accessory protein TnpB [Escherichia coli]
MSIKNDGHYFCRAGGNRPDGLNEPVTAKVQTALKDDPMSGHVFIFRGRSGSQVKLLWSTGDGLCLLTKRLERGRFAWPSARDGKVFLTQAQLAMLLEGIDWRQPKRLLTSLTML